MLTIRDALNDLARPTPLQDMIRDVAARAAAKSNVAVDAAAMSTLETALDSIFLRLMSSAYERAKSKGRDTISREDIEFVRKTLRK